jgi:hypothetical protein
MGWSCPVSRCSMTSGSRVSCRAGSTRSARHASAGPSSWCTARTPSSRCTGTSAVRRCSSICGPTPPSARTTPPRRLGAGRGSGAAAGPPRHAAAGSPARRHSGCGCTATASGPSSVYLRGAGRWSTVWNAPAANQHVDALGSPGYFACTLQPGAMVALGATIEGWDRLERDPRQVIAMEHRREQRLLERADAAARGHRPRASCSPPISSSSRPPTGRATRPGPAPTGQDAGASSPATPGSPTGAGTR